MLLTQGCTLQWREQQQTQNKDVARLKSIKHLPVESGHLIIIVIVICFLECTFEWTLECEMS